MIHKLVCAMFVLAVSIGLVTAEEFRCTVKKVDGKNVTFAKFNFKDKDKKVEEMTLPVAKGVKVNKGTRDFKAKKTEVGDAIEGGLKNEMFSKIDEKKGLFVQITTSEDNKTITDIVVLPAFEFKKKKDEKKTDK
jgi:hypothetical protein